MKLYVWEDVLWDYTPGLAVALADNVEDARGIIAANVSGVEKIGLPFLSKYEDVRKEVLNELTEKEPVICEVEGRVAPIAFWVYGGS